MALKRVGRDQVFGIMFYFLWMLAFLTLLERTRAGWGAWDRRSRSRATGNCMKHDSGRGGAQQRGRESRTSTSEWQRGRRRSWKVRGWLPPVHRCFSPFSFSSLCFARDGSWGAIQDASPWAALGACAPTQAAVCIAAPRNS
eukprot:882625-Rhodomonas_salina.4